MTSTTSPARRGLVTISMAAAPTNSSRLRSATDTVEPTTVWISVVSVVSRDRISPVFVTSKKLGLSFRIWANTSRRRSATTRSPTQATR